MSIKDAVNTALVTMKVTNMGSLSTNRNHIRRYLTCAETAKLVRQVLKLAFPGTKFSVRSNVYSGGASIDINWVGGPDEKTVKSAVSIFQGATFDGMIDLKEYNTLDLNGEKISFGADFIFCTRKEVATNAC
jgi:hypothetical protein